MFKSTALAFSIALDTTPILRCVWRWFWERDMELDLREPHSRVVRGRDGLNIPKQAGPIINVVVGENPHIHIWLDLVLTNHRTSRKEVITGCELHLKKRHWLLWRKTIALAQVLVDKSYQGAHRHVAWEPIIIGRMAKPVVITVWAEGEIVYPAISFPKKTWLFLEFSMVGPRRRMSREIETVLHKSPSRLDI